MRIEKINDNQIRCTLTKDDLADRQIKLSELAYGTEKTKMLFRDMMQQAALDFGFEAGDIPLMIEAIPLPNECIVLIITKVEDPEELDTRFSKFAPSGDLDEGLSQMKGSMPERADNVLDLFRQILEGRMKKTEDSKEEAVPNTAAPTVTKIYTFQKLDDVIAAAAVLKDYYRGPNALYKTKNPKSYTLVLGSGRHTPEEFNKICNMLSEYGTCGKYSVASEAYLQEHEEVILAKLALQKLGQI